METHATLPAHASLAAMAGHAADRFPGHNALYINDRFYTYAGLWECVKAVYAQIPADRVYSRIGIYCTNDVCTYAAILAVNLYGAAYVPLNPKFPVQRNRSIAEESRVELILDPSGNEDPETIAGKVPLIRIRESGINTGNVVLEQVNKKNTVWYILFTSGSTGRPKSVPVTADNLRHFFNYYLEHYDFNERDRFLQVYELTFDVSVFSFFMPLLVGACCYVLPDEGIRPVKIIGQLEQHKISVLSMVPTVLGYLRKYFSEIMLPGLRYSFFSGDALYHELAVQWSRCVPNAAIHNFYGPTETTIVCTRYIFDEKRSAEESVNGIVPLGKAFDGMHWLIVGGDEQPCEKGELCFSGPQVFPGYPGNADEDSFFQRDGLRFYKTGDMAAVNGYGNLVFYGRTDEQVKINGYRVELKEVEAAIVKALHCACKVMALKDPEGRNVLHAFAEVQQLDKAEVTDLLAAELPAYMIPQGFTAVAQLPLGINGKIDGNKLLHLQK